MSRSRASNTIIIRPTFFCFSCFPSSGVWSHRDKYCLLDTILNVSSCSIVGSLIVPPLTPLPLMMDCPCSKSQAIHPACTPRSRGRLLPPQAFAHRRILATLSCQTQMEGWRWFSSVEADSRYCHYSGVFFFVPSSLCVSTVHPELEVWFSW